MANRTKRDFWQRTLSAVKVREALESLGGDLGSFERAYTATRRLGGPRTLTEEQTAAVKHFASNGRNIDSLATALGVKAPAARGVVARAVEAGII